MGWPSAPSMQITLVGLPHHACGPLPAQPTHSPVTSSNTQMEFPNLGPGYLEIVVAHLITSRPSADPCMWNIELPRAILESRPTGSAHTRHVEMLSRVFEAQSGGEGFGVGGGRFCEGGDLERHEHLAFWTLWHRRPPQGRTCMHASCPHTWY